MKRRLIVNSRTAAPATALLLSSDHEWIRAVEGAMTTLGRRVVQTASSRDAMVDVSGLHPFHHMLVDPSAAGDNLPSLIDLTCGEADSGVDLIVLGSAHIAGVHAVTRPDPAMIASALLLPAGQCHCPRDEKLVPTQIAPMLQDGSLRVRFQPIVRMADRAVIGFELLARLNRPTCGTIPPGRFVPLVEQLGLGLALTRGVVGTGLAALPSLAGGSIAVNLPLDVLVKAETVAIIAELIGAAGVPAAKVIIELTESQRVTDVPGLERAVGHWRDAGFRLAIDDAGRGVPNHRALFRLPFDFVKLDKSVVRQALRSAPARTYLTRTVTAARRENLSIIAEGLEEPAAWDMLAQLDVDAAQGFLIGRPLPLGAVPAWRAGWERTDAF